MPYIKDLKKDLDYKGVLPDSPGELNYVITRTVMKYMLSKGVPDYAALNEVVGVLESAKLEFVRRMVNPYEDLKKEENGDVYR